jgi:soluble lytic murein transglycosylase-like protein
MKKVTILLAATLVLACSGTDPAALLLNPAWASTSSLTVAAVQESQPDLGLLLYRDERTRRAVESFYIKLTGSSEISLPVLRYAEANDIPLPLAFALAWGESGFNTRAYNRNVRSVDRGLFQLNSATFPFLKAEQFYDPEINARYGLKHLRFCLDREGSELVALAVYNAGALKVHSGTPYSTLNHIARILEYRNELRGAFQRLREGSPLLDHLASRLGPGS